MLNRLLIYYSVEGIDCVCFTRRVQEIKNDKPEEIPAK